MNPQVVVVAQPPPPTRDIPSSNLWAIERIAKARACYPEPGSELCIMRAACFKRRKLLSELCATETSQLKPRGQLPSYSVSCAL